MEQEAQIDNPLDDFPFPPFISHDKNGVIAHLAKLQLTSEFELFVSRVFSSGLIFHGLEYPVFQRLLYDEDWVNSLRGAGGEVRFASEIQLFPNQRKPLYHSVKLVEGGKSAEYMFEPVGIEVSYQEPVYGEPDEFGIVPIVEYRMKTRIQPARLDMDEFVADMWLKEIRFGIDTETVHSCIQSGVSQRVKIARQLEPTAGRDAEIKEASTHLHRDDAPKILPNGKADLRVFKNRFPQMAKGERMIQKIPRALGKFGRKINGEAIEPSLPKDIDISQLAAMGTRVDVGADGEYLVAAVDGFLHIDNHTNQISVTEKIENKGGVSVRTTGDLDLSVDEFIEHGEVQEGRLVEGKQMTFLSDVFGKILSHEGNIHIKSCLAGGKAEALSGNIEIKGNISRADVRARHGEVVGEIAESSILLGRVVRIKYAVNCDIVADELYADQLEGCSVAAKKLVIASAGERRGRDTAVTVLLPDFSTFDQYIEKLQKRRAEVHSKITVLTNKMSHIKAEPEFAKFLNLEAGIRKGEIKLNESQAFSWRKIVEKHSAASKLLIRLKSEIDALAHSEKDIEVEREFTKNEKAALADGISCEISQIKSHTLGQSMRSANGVDFFAELSASDIRALLQKTGGEKSRIFASDSGSVAWQFALPQH